MIQTGRVSCSCALVGCASDGGTIGCTVGKEAKLKQAEIFDEIGNAVGWGTYIGGVFSTLLIFFIFLYLFLYLFLFFLLLL